MDQDGRSEERHRKDSIITTVTFRNKAARREQARQAKGAKELVDTAVQTHPAGHDIVRVLIGCKVQIDIWARQTLSSSLPIVLQEAYLQEGVDFATSLFDLFDDEMHVEQADILLVHSSLCNAQYTLGRRIVYMTHAFSFEPPYLCPEWDLGDLILPTDDADANTRKFYDTRLAPLRQRTARLIKWFLDVDPHTQGFEELDDVKADADTALQQWTTLISFWGINNPSHYGRSRKGHSKDSNYYHKNKSARREQARLYQRLKRAKEKTNTPVDSQECAKESSTLHINAAVQTYPAGHDVVRVLMGCRVQIDIWAQCTLGSSSHIVLQEDYLRQGVDFAMCLFDLFDVEMHVEQADILLVHSSLCNAQYRLGHQIVRMTHIFSFEPPYPCPGWKLECLILPPDGADANTRRFYNTRLAPLRLRTARLIHWFLDFDPRTVGLEELDDVKVDVGTALHQWTILFCWKAVGYSAKLRVLYII
ncbi:hypothetical protein BDP27DRAFT_1374370 [Rhodocollybia butyracea]|uniref:Uncharacterized protein n=1 Tax=Rhodocollybia butyracea TaxID=206335 RepID=A0A9P5P833_9AGAR|nr:hypothetical protein BDP27DRAFT_1374370 [Rhodocollybia butyracea]